MSHTDLGQPDLAALRDAAGDAKFAEAEARLVSSGYPLAERVAARIEQARAEQAVGVNPLGLVFPSPTGKHWRSSNFNRNVLQRAYRAIG